MVAEIAGAVNGITNLVGSGQQRKAQQAEQRHRLVQMVLASKMQNQQAQIQQQDTSKSNNNSTYILIGVGFIIIIALIFIVWHKQQKIS